MNAGRALMVKHLLHPRNVRRKKSHMKDLVGSEGGGGGYGMMCEKLNH